MSTPTTPSGATCGCSRPLRRSPRQATGTPGGLAAHLEHEERDATARVQKHLTTEDWHRIEESSFRARKNLADLTRVVPWAVHELPAETRRQAFREAGLLFEILWRAARRRFERLEARATRHLR